MRFVKWLIPAVLIGLAIRPAVRLSKRLQGMAPMASVATLRVEPDVFLVTVTADHRVQACKEASAATGARVYGKLSYVCEDGARVKEGDVIARLDDKDIVRELDDARLAYSNSLAQVSQAERERKNEVETTRNAVEQAKRELELLLKTNATELEEAQKQLDYNRLREQSARLEYERKQRLASPEVGLVPRDEVEQAGRNLRSAEFAVTTAEKRLDLLNKQQASKVEQKQSDIADAEYKLKVAEAAVTTGVESARYNIESRKDRLQAAEERLAMTVVKAPASGIAVLSMYWSEQGPRPIKVGDNVWSGFSIATISDLSCLEVRLPVDQSRIAPVRVGQEALLTFEALPGKTYHGAVEYISPSATEALFYDDPTVTPGARRFTVRISVKDPDARLRPGLKCKVQIVLERLGRVLAVPLSAVIREGGRDLVYVRRSKSFVRQRVRTGPRNDEAVVIMRGLKPGDVVALQDPTGGAEE